MYGDKLIRRKIIKKKRENVRNKWITWPLMWLNRSVAIINVTLQLSHTLSAIVAPEV